MASPFLDSFDRIEACIRDICAELGVPEPVLRHTVEMLRYNVHGGKCIRGQFLVDLCQALGLRSVSKTHTLGWCIELAFFLVADDIMDSSETRRGKPCWYKRVGMTALNDSFLLCTLMFRVLEVEFAPDVFAVLVGAFNSAILRTQFGQMMDMQACRDKSLLTYEQWSQIASNKTAEYSFVLPAKLAFVLCFFEDIAVAEPAPAYEAARLMGVFFQMQDDYLDVYGDPAVMGKTGSDIEEGKCAWPVVTALGVADKAVGERLLAAYGTSDRASVVDIMNGLRIPEAYADRSAAFHSEIQDRIGSIQDARVKAVFGALCQRLFNRAR